MALPCNPERRRVCLFQSISLSRWLRHQMYINLRSAPAELPATRFSGEAEGVAEPSTTILSFARSALCCRIHRFQIRHHPAVRVGSVILSVLTGTVNLSVQYTGSWSLWIRFGGFYVTLFPNSPEKHDRRVDSGCCCGVVAVFVGRAGSAAESRFVYRLSVAQPGRHCARGFEPSIPTATSTRRHQAPQHADWLRSNGHLQL